MPRRDRSTVKSAFQYAEEAHRNQTRHSGEPYITHPMAVASYVAEMKMDCEAVSAALLHDVVEDTKISLANIEARFGENIAWLVDGLTKLDNIKSDLNSENGSVTQSHGNLSLVQSENFQKLVLATAKDLRVILIKFSDRLHNLRTIESLTLEKRKRIARETMLIYAPLANRLGMEKMRMELEDLSFAAVYPMRYTLIKSAVEEARSSRKDYIENIIGTINTRMQEEGVKCSIIGRRKNLAGIYSKMAARSSVWREDDIQESAHDKKSLQEIMDVYGMRLIVDKVEVCYQALGIIHSLFVPINSRVKDYIANPKKNGYQSLHTTLVGPNGFPLEIQIRTEAMEQVASSGVAAHFIYKNRVADPSRLYAWFDVLTRIQAESQDTLDFMGKAKEEMNVKEIFVYTPNGDLISLPEKATPVDFAYAVHTDVGAKCIACEIDRTPMPLNTQLKTGQVIKIITDPNGTPDLSWSAYVTTPKALSHIAHYASVQRNVDLRSAGEKMLRDTLTNHFNSDIKLIPSKNWDSYLRKHKLKNRGALYERIASGEITPLLAVASLLSISDSKGKRKLATAKKKSRTSIGISRDLAIIRYARCCHPIPGDNIIAIATQEGINIHREKCKNIASDDKEKKPYKITPAHWEMDEDQQFLVSVRCECTQIGDIMSSVVNALSNNQVPVQEIITEHSSANAKVLRITMLVHSRGHLASILKKLRFVKGISKIHRY